MTPIERAARAAYRELKDDLDIHQMGEEAMWKDHLPLVRAVLTAIRHPSDLMVEAAGINNDWLVENKDDVRRLLWRKMVDIALEEKL